jgi:hypothetical protein
MSDYIAWINAHGIEVMIVWYVFSAFVSSMPSPSESSNNLYKFAFTFMHTLAGSIGRIPYFRNITDGQGTQTTSTVQTATVTTTEPVQKTVDTAPPKV